MLAKNIMLGLGGVAAAIMLSACGAGVPDCDDSNAQTELKKKFLEHTLEQRGFSKDSKDEFNKKAAEILSAELKYEISNFMTEKKDEKRNRAVCKAEISGTIDEEKLREVIVLGIKSKFARNLSQNEVLTDSRFEEMVSQKFGSSSKYESAVDKEVEKALETFDSKAHRLEYVLRETDDGKLVVNLENY